MNILNVPLSLAGDRRMSSIKRCFQMLYMYVQTLKRQKCVTCFNTSFTISKNVINSQTANQKTSFCVFSILHFQLVMQNKKGFYILTYSAQPDRWQFNFLLFFQLIHHSRRNSQHTQISIKPLFCADLGEALFFHFIRLFVQRFWNLNLQTKREKLSSDDGSLVLNPDKKRKS